MGRNTDGPTSLGISISLLALLRFLLRNFGRRRKCRNPISSISSSVQMMGRGRARDVFPFQAKLTTEKTFRFSPLRGRGPETHL